MRHHAADSDQPAVTHEVTHPAIADHGGVVRLPDAAQQPRPWTKLLVDLTRGGEPDQVNPGLEKVAKYVNIYAGAGAEPAEVKMALVFHGQATLAVLKDDAYAAKFHTDGNPNLELLKNLHKEGVELYVCGQTLISKGAALGDVAETVQPAVSALTAVVNLQADGYAYVPLAHVAPASPAKQTTAAEKAVATAETAAATAPQAHGHPHGGGRGLGPQGAGGMQGMQSDMTTLHSMFDNRDKIKRSVKLLPDGAEAVTESDDETIADLLKQHVPAMEDRVLGNKPLPPMTFHPVFVALIKHAEDYHLTYEETDKGMKVTYHAEDPYVVMLVQEHAKLVSRFIENGMEEIHTPYELPKLPKETKQ
ncbi:DsrE family protein [Roseimaritima ulvae]|nr:DsrE family protein [Roseimaritima ulvae]